jgi:hypothetical protein
MLSLRHLQKIPSHIALLMLSTFAVLGKFRGSPSLRDPEAITGQMRLETNLKLPTHEQFDRCAKTEGCGATNL